MPVNLDDLDLFKEICRKICLNIPEHAQWQWDDERDMAVMTLDSEDAELVFFPLFKEFENHWDFSSQGVTPKTSATEYLNSRYGLMPGQAFFTSYSLCDLFLSVAWWPWGCENKVSMRIGLIPTDLKEMENDMAFQCLSRWLNITRVE